MQEIYKSLCLETRDNIFSAENNLILNCMSYLYFIFNDVKNVCLCVFVHMSPQVPVEFPHRAWMPCSWRFGRLWASQCGFWNWIVFLCKNTNQSSCLSPLSSSQIENICIYIWYILCQGNMHGACVMRTDNRNYSRVGTTECLSWIRSCCRPVLWDKNSASHCIILEHLCQQAMCVTDADRRHLDTS